MFMLMNSLRDYIHVCHLHDEPKQETHVVLKLKPPAKMLHCDSKPQRKCWLYQHPIGRFFVFLLLLLLF